MAHFIQRVRRGKIDFDTFVDLAVSCLQERLQDEPVMLSYYRDVLPA